jgi:cyclic pyranopterin phosphate synthase
VSVKNPHEPEQPLTHLDEKGQAHMVEVGAKPETARLARARGAIELRESTLRRILAGDLPKGEVLSVARLAAIGATKRTAELIPLCHPLRITGVDVAFQPLPAARSDESDPPRQLEITVEVRAFDRTGVEMEALTAVTVAALTVYDMCKAVDRGMRIVDVSLVEKRGGRSGLWQRPGGDEPGRGQG